MIRKAKVMLMSCVHPWDDTRILFREARSLSSYYQVEVHALADFDTRYYGDIKIVGLRRLPRWARPLNWFLLGWRAWRSSTLVVHFHDPELLPLALLLRLLGKMVIYDVHEDVYEDILQKPWLSPLMRIVLGKLYSLFHRLGDHQLSAIITATENIAERFQNSRLAVVRNYPPLDLFRENDICRYSYTSGRELRIVYVGSLNQNRGILQMIRALTYLPEEYVYHLDVVGLFPEEKNLEQEALEAVFPVRDHVTFHGHVEFLKALRLMKRAHIGLICTQPTVNDLAGIPMKLFEYMAAGLGVVISEFPKWHPYIAKYPPHEYVDPTNPEDIARGILELAGRLSLYENVWKKVQDDVLAHFEWNSQGQRLLDIYSSLILSEAIL